ncbi:hypothetical protein D3H34_09765 [Acidovorax cavernicola]|uniref:Carbohydrate-binding module family 19 domain-containing protein n=1 Tax=Acidovorax cavernicola TaxID=1675792 RepID=A0A9X8GVW8_9BURK|nr:hypothetical protein D3H34_09765 [Acidovorax cavernicola]
MPRRQARAPCPVKGQAPADQGKKNRPCESKGRFFVKGFGKWGVRSNVLRSCPRGPDRRPRSP